MQHFEAYGSSMPKPNGNNNAMAQQNKQNAEY